MFRITILFYIYTSYSRILLCFNFFFGDIEKFADSLHIPHLRQCFSELKELIRALLHPDLLQMAENPNLRRSLFPRFDTIHIISMLEKVK